MVPMVKGDLCLLSDSIVVSLLLSLEVSGYMTGHWKRIGSPEGLYLSKILIAGFNKGIMLSSPVFCLDFLMQ